MNNASIVLYAIGALSICGAVSYEAFSIGGTMGWFVSGFIIIILGGCISVYQEWREECRKEREREELKRNIEQKLKERNKQ